MTKAQEKEYRQFLSDRQNGRILTPDGLRFICSSNEYDPEKIGIHMLTVLANWNKIDVTE